MTSPKPPGCLDARGRADLPNGAPALEISTRRTSSAAATCISTARPAVGTAVDDGVVDELGDDEADIVELGAGGDGAERLVERAPGDGARAAAARQLDARGARRVVRPGSGVQQAGAPSPWRCGKAGGAGRRRSPAA